MTDADGLVAYFSPEFGLDEALPQYSGGLGVLAGDHLKAAADARIPLVGVGIFYRHGYFRQGIGQDGRMEVDYDHFDPATLGLQEVGETDVPVADRSVVLRVWRRDVGSVPLFLVDSDVPGNEPEDRAITDRLYGGDTEHRIRQEIVLGMGGLRALDAAGVTPEVFHLNEGHAGFLVLERIRRFMAESGSGDGLDAAVAALRGSTVFTTHTPVPAGIDRFSRELMERYVGPWCADVGVDIEDLLALGHMPGEGGEPAKAGWEEDEDGSTGARETATDVPFTHEPSTDTPFNMAAFCLRVAGHANGVSRLHGEVSRRMFAPLWPDRAEDDVPIGHVTNGVHAPTWTSPEIAELLSSAVGPDWPSAVPEAWSEVQVVGTDGIRAARRAAKQRLAEVVAERSAIAGAALDPEALVIGFARRFATYKRAAMLVSEKDRLVRLLTDPGRPVQIVFSGKPHPADRQGQEVLTKVARAAADPDFNGRVVLLSDYDMGVARALVQGCDVWLNTPIRGLEASGTSGEKAALNGVLNCSISDGWWDEMFDGKNGWVISARDDLDAGELRDRAEAAAAFEVLEHEVIPLYFEEDPADGDGGSRPSTAWVDRIRSAWTSLGPQVSADRMIRDYVEVAYRPATAGT